MSPFPPKKLTLMKILCKKTFTFFTINKERTFKVSSLHKKLVRIKSCENVGFWHNVGFEFIKIDSAVTSRLDLLISLKVNSDTKHVSSVKVMIALNFFISQNFDPYRSLAENIN